jgi:hypothetical protein
LLEEGQREHAAEFFTVFSNRDKMRRLLEKTVAANVILAAIQMCHQPMKYLNKPLT